MTTVTTSPLGGVAESRYVLAVSMQCIARRRARARNRRPRARKGALGCTTEAM